MRPISKVLLFTTLALSACSSAPPVMKADPAAAEREIMQRVDSLLYRYSQNDQAGVLAMLDPERFTIFGSAQSEVIHTTEEMRGLMSRDFAQWQTATFSDVRQVDVRSDGTLATAYFTVTFSAGGGPTLPIRLCTTWRKVNGEWLLTQSANAVLPG